LHGLDSVLIHYNIIDNNFDVNLQMSLIIIYFLGLLWFKKQI